MSRKKGTMMRKKKVSVSVRLWQNGETRRIKCYDLFAHEAGSNKLFAIVPSNLIDEAIRREEILNPLLRVDGNTLYWLQRQKNVIRLAEGSHMSWMLAGARLRRTFVIPCYTDFLSCLPKDVLWIIIRFLPLKDVFELMRVCKTFHALLSSNESWCEQQTMRWWRENKFHEKFSASNAHWPELMREGSAWGISWKFVAQCIVGQQRGGKYKWKLSFDGKSLFIGEKKDSICHGRNISFHTETESYVGWWHEGEIHEEGYIIYDDGLRYRGRFAKGLWDGYGVLFDLTRIHYRGHYAKGSKHGKGISYLKTGATYDGEFVNGERCGYGILFYGPSGNRYQGFFEKDKFHGNGTIYYSTGERFCTTFNNGQPADETLCRHDEIKKAIKENRCTWSVTKHRKHWYHQFYFRCLTCKDVQWRCETCKTKCHPIDNHEWEKRWHWYDDCMCPH